LKQDITIIAILLWLQKPIGIEINTDIPVGGGLQFKGNCFTSRELLDSLYGRKASKLKKQEVYRICSCLHCFIF
jgi:hypothetical protein